MTAPERPCSICGKECQVWERNQDGTYTHTSCAQTVAGYLLASPGPEEKEA